MGKERDDKNRVVSEKTQKEWRSRTKNDVKFAELNQYSDNSRNGKGTDNYMTQQLVKAELAFKEGNYQGAYNILTKTYRDMGGWIQNSRNQDDPFYGKRADQYLDSIAKRAERFSSKLRKSGDQETDKLVINFDKVAETAKSAKGSKKLEKMVSTSFVWASVASFILFLFFVSPTLTGYSLVGFGQATNRSFASLFFIAFIVTLFFVFRLKRKK
jgi:hypothetical protein